MSTDKSLAAHRIKQKKLYKIRILLFGCRKNCPKNSQSGDSLACISKTSELVDVSSSSLDIDRIPAGGYAPCGCPTANTNPTTHEMSTQTDDDEIKSESRQTEDDRKDAGTQLSYAELANDSNRSFIQVQYSNVSKRFQPPSYIVGQEEEPPSDADSICEKLSQKLSPLIVVDRSHSKLSGSRSNPPRNPPQGSQPPRGSPAKSQPTRGQIARDTRQRGQPPRGQIATENKTPRSQQRSNKRQGAVAFEPPNQNRQNRSEEQDPPALDKEQGRLQTVGDLGAQSTQDKQTQSDETEKPTENKPSASFRCSRIPEILNRLCVVETRLKQQERTIKSLKCAMNSSPPSKCSLPCPPICTLPCPPKCTPPCPSKCILPCPPKCTPPCPPKCPDKKCGESSNCSVQDSTKSCKSTTSACCKPNCEEDYPDCQVLKKEFIDIFIKPDPNACCKKEIQKPINICPLKNNCQDARKMCIQCLEKSDILMQQFNHMFVKPAKGNLDKSNKKRQPSLQQLDPETENCKVKPEKEISSGLFIPTDQCLTQPESKIGNILDKCVDLIATKSQSAVSASGLVENNAPEPCDSHQNLQKEVYESLMEQFIKYFTKPKTECEQDPPLAPKAEGERYSFERLCSELFGLFTRTRNLELNAVQNEYKPKSMTILASNTILEKDQKTGCQGKSISELLDKRNEEKPCQVEYISKDPSVSLGGCQSCCDNGNLPVLDSLVDEMMKLIDCRPLRDVVLTIMRRGCNVYHINVRERATGSVLGCMQTNGAAINEAISLGLFEDIPTFCELNKQEAEDPRDCPLDAIVPRREPGGDNQRAKKARAIEFFTRVLGLPFGEAQRFFSLTNVLNTARTSLSDQSLVGTELSRVSENPGLIGRGAITDNLIFLGSVHDLPGTTISQLDMSELGEVSKHFLHLLSGLDIEDKDKV